MSERIPAEMWPPGTFLSEEMTARGLCHADVAVTLGTDIGDVSLLLDGKRTLTATDAQRLARLLGGSADYWIRLEHGYRTWAGGE